MVELRLDEQLLARREVDAGADDELCIARQKVVSGAHGDILHVRRPL